MYLNRDLQRRERRYACFVSVFMLFAVFAVVALIAFELLLPVVHHLQRGLQP